MLPVKRLESRLGQAYVSSERYMTIGPLVHFIYNSLVTICGDRAVLLAFLFCCFTFCRLIVCIPFPFGVWCRMEFDFIGP